MWAGAVRCIADWDGNSQLQNEHRYTNIALRHTKTKTRTKYKTQFDDDDDDDDNNNNNNNKN